MEIHANTPLQSLQTVQTLLGELRTSLAKTEADVNESVPLCGENLSGLRQSVGTDTDEGILIQPTYNRSVPNRVVVAQP